LGEKMQSPWRGRVHGVERVRKGEMRGQMMTRATRHAHACRVARAGEFSGAIFKFHPNCGARLLS